MPRWTEIILILIGVVVVLGIVASLVTEVFMRRRRAKRTGPGSPGT